MRPLPSSSKRIESSADVIAFLQAISELVN